MKKHIPYLYLLVLLLTACKTVTGVVVDENGTPVKNAFVSIDCAKKAQLTAQSGYFHFKTKAKGKHCLIRAWTPADTTTQTTIKEYEYRAGQIKLTINKKQ